MKFTNSRAEFSNHQSPLGLFFIAGDIEINVVLENRPPLSEHTHEGWTYYVYPNMWLVHTGIGAMNAACAAYAFGRSYSPAFFIQLGFSGAHKSDLKIGDIILGKKVKDFSRHTKEANGKITPRSLNIQCAKEVEQLESYIADPGLYSRIKRLLEQQSLAYYEGIVGGADQFNRDPAFITKIHRTYHTLCEDMESAAIAYVATRFHIPFADIRVISNNELTRDGKTHCGQQFKDYAFKVLKHVGHLMIDRESEILQNN